MCHLLLLIPALALKYLYHIQSETSGGHRDIPYSLLECKDFQYKFVFCFLADLLKNVGQEGIFFRQSEGRKCENNGAHALLLCKDAVLVKH